MSVIARLEAGCRRLAASCSDQKNLSGASRALMPIYPQPFAPSPQSQSISLRRHRISDICRPVPVHDMRGNQSCVAGFYIRTPAMNALMDQVLPLGKALHGTAGGAAQDQIFLKPKSAW